jgi:hypothetical protein
MSHINKTTTVSRDLKMIEGIKKHLGNVSSVVIASKSYTPQQCVDVLQARVDAVNAAAAARATFLNLVQAARAEIAQTKQFVSALRQAIYLMFSSAIDILADFGVPAHKARKPPPPTKTAVTVEKAKATRAARHTMGKKQKLAIKGTVSDAVGAAPAPASPPAPLPAAGDGNAGHGSSGPTGGANGAPPQGAGSPQ